MTRLLLLLTLAFDGGTVTLWEGTLEPGVTSVLTGTHDPARGVDLLADTFRPPTLKLPNHHAGRIEWVGDVVIPTGKVRLVFKVEGHAIARIAERRWNSTWTCRVISALPP